MRTTRSLRASIGILATSLFISLSPLAARADVSDEDRSTARTLAVEGQVALDKNDFATAEDRFTRANALVHAPTLMLGMARARVGLGKLLSAQEIYNTILREGVPAGAPPAFARALDDAKKEVAALAPRVPSITIVVKGAASADVTIDGKAVPPAAIGVKRSADPGKHIIKAIAAGMAPFEVTVTIGEGKNETVTVELKPQGAVVPPPVKAPQDKPKEPPKGDVKPVKPAPATSEPPKSQAANNRGSLQRTLGFAGIGVGGAALIMGAVTGGLALGKHGDLKEQCPNGTCPESAFGTLDSYHLMGTLSTVGFVVGGVFAATGVVLVATAPKAKTGAPAKQGVWISPVVSPSYLGVEGSF